MRRRTVAYVGVLGLLLASSAGATLISFAGDYAPANWTLTTGGGNGSVNTSGAPAAITLVGSDTGGGILSVVTVYSITVPSPTVLDFFWLYQTFDTGGPGYDLAGYSVNAVPTQLSNSSGLAIQSGSVSGLNLAAGDTFAFYVNATDDCCGPAQITISATEIPEPGTLTLLAAGLGLAALLRRRR